MKHFNYIITVIILTFVITQNLFSNDFQRTELEQGNDVGERNALAMDLQGNPHIIYTRPYNLKYAYRDTNANWHIDILESVGLGGFSSLSIDIDVNEIIHISYRKSNEGIKYGYKDHSGWTFSLIDGVSDNLLGSTIKVDAFGKIHVAYVIWGGGSYEVRYATKEGNDWNVNIIESGISWDHARGFFSNNLFKR